MRFEYFIFQPLKVNNVQGLKIGIKNSIEVQNLHFFEGIPLLHETFTWHRPHAYIGIS